MPGKVCLEVTRGPLLGKRFEFQEKDTFLFGRSSECHAHLPRGDRTASRHHFLLEVNPPEVRLQDLGSLNGTLVNGVKYGGREPASAVDLRDGDRIRVGETEFQVQAAQARCCCECGTVIAPAQVESCRWVGDTLLCSACRARVEAQERDRAEALERAKVQAQQRPQVEAAPMHQGPPPPRGGGGGPAGVLALGPPEGGNGWGGGNEAAQHRADPLAVLLALLAGRSPGEPPVSIPGYEVVRPLGQGGMGAVYLARRQLDRAEVAIKVMLSRVAVDPNARKAFEREIEITQSLRHPNLVDLFEHGSAGVGFYFVMEVCRGGGVEDLMRKRGGRLSLKEAAPIMLGALRGLAHAHAQGFVHRDLKPSNILLSESGLAKIADFGMAKEFERAGFSGMTATGQVGGTPAFMPREQVVMFRDVRPVTDVWSLGATFYNMLTGCMAKEFAPGQEPMRVILQDKVVPITQRDPSLPRGVVEAIHCALEENLSARYQNGGDMLGAFERVLPSG